MSLDTTLDTTLGGNPDSLRRVADWLRSDFGPAADAMATAVYWQRSRLASSRPGADGDDSRARTTALASTADRIALSAGETSRDLDRLAAALQRAQEGLDSVRGDARAAGLCVDGHLIHEPAPGGTPGLVEAWHVAVRAAAAYGADWSAALAAATRTWGEHDADLGAMAADLGLLDETPAPS